MSCETYREALTDAAAGGSALPGELRAHVDTCAACRGFFDAERRLFAGIDSAVQSTANTPVPASLLPRVRAELKERPVERGFGVRAWSAVAVAAVLVVSVVASRTVHHGAEPPTVVDKPATEAVARVDAPPKANFNASRQAKEQARPRTSKHHAQEPVKEEAVVLVPPRQKAGIDRLLFGLQHGKVDGAVLLAKNPESSQGELQIAPIEVSPIVVKPLEEEDREAAPLGLPTKR